MRYSLPASNLFNMMSRWIRV